MNDDQPNDNANNGSTRRGRNSFRRERRTIRAMIGIYCRAHHGTVGELCDACAELHDYAMARLDRCPFGCDKPTCAQCPIHCYKRDMREEVKNVMRFAGPRMLTRHPLLAVLHTVDSIRAKKNPPPKPRKGNKQ